MTILDVSEANGSIDWAQAGPQVDGAVLRLGYRGYGQAGTLVTDARWEANAAGCAAVGLPWGAYWVSQALTEAEAEQEAAYVLARLAGKEPALPVFLDSEWGEAQRGTGRADRIGSARRTANALAFLRRLRAAGYRTGLYTGPSWFRTELDGEAIRADGHFIWLASVEHVEPQIACDGWQYTWQGRVPGVATNVDLSRFRDPRGDGDGGNSGDGGDGGNSGDGGDGGDWSAAARDWAVARGLFRGDGSGHYDWGGCVTREQLATVLYRALGESQCAP